MSPRVARLLRIGLPVSIATILVIAILVPVLSAKRAPLDNDSNQLFKNYPVDNRYSNASTTSPAAGAFPDFNFGAAGDWGYNNNAVETARNMAGHGVELAIFLGDFSYTSDSFEIDKWWTNDITPLHGISVAALGNHDDLSPTMMNQYHSLFELADEDPNNDWVYSFDYQNVHFLAMNTEASASARSEQYDFVKDDLDSAASNPDVMWIVVFMHKPPYTSPAEHEAEADLQENFHPLFDLYGVDLVLYAHNHNYQRTFPLKYNAADSSNPIIETTEKTNYRDPLGQVYVTAGTAGQSHYRLEEQAPFVVTQDDNVFGFINVDIINGGKTMKATFYSNDDSVLDTFTIDKSSGATVILPPTGMAEDLLRIGDIRKDAFDSVILRESSAVGWPDPMLMKAQISQESDFNPLANTLGSKWASPCGLKEGWTENESQSFGLFQITPACGGSEDDMGIYPAGAELAGHPILVSSKSDPYWSQSFYNGDFNVHFGMYIMSGHLKYFENAFPDCSESQHMKMALAAHRSSRQSVSGCDSFTSTAQNYINHVLAHYHDFADKAGYPDRM